MPQLTIKLLLGLIAHTASVEQYQMGLLDMLGQLVIGLLEQASNTLRVVLVHLATIGHNRQFFPCHVYNSLVTSAAAHTPCWRKKVCWSSSRSSTAAPCRSRPSTHADGSPIRQNSAAANRARCIEQWRRSAPMNNTPSRSASLRSAPRRLTPCKSELVRFAPRRSAPWRLLPASTQFLSCTPAICAPRKLTWRRSSDKSTWLWYGRKSAVDRKRSSWCGLRFPDTYRSSRQKSALL